MDKDEIKKIVKKRYGNIAKQGTSCCESKKMCCGTTSTDDISKNIGYTKEELRAVPDEANLGLGCGNPTALASINEGEVVLDLGSGAGFDCFLAANKVGKQGKVIGVDMTSDMIEKARANADKGGYSNVEFRLGDIENLPVDNESVDVVVSNCVINLSPDKRKVFQESYRVLKPGGRLVVSDIVLTKELPEVIKNSIEAYVGCVSGAAMKDRYLELIRKAGFQDVTVTGETSFPVELFVNDPTAESIIKKANITEEDLEKVGSYVISIKVICKKY